MSGPVNPPLDAEDWQRLLSAARSAAAHAHCPYSGFRVGAAVMVRTGHIFAGCNVENASYGLTICAERSAMVQAVSAGETALRAVLIYTPTAEPVTPCGACRQFLSEFGSTVEVRCHCDGPQHLSTTLDDLLPAAFGSTGLDSQSQ